MHGDGKVWQKVYGKKRDFFSRKTLYGKLQVGPCCRIEMVSGLNFEYSFEPVPGASNPM